MSLSYDLVEVMDSVETPSLSACVGLCSVAGAAAHRPAAKHTRFLINTLWKVALIIIAKAPPFQKKMKKNAVRVVSPNRQIFPVHCMIHEIAFEIDQ